MKEDKNIWVIVAVVLVIFLFKYLNLFAIYNTDQASIYQSFLSDSNSVSYVQIDTSAQRNAFKDIHALNEDYADEFSYPQENKEMVKLYLDMNGINSSEFDIWNGEPVNSVIRPKGVEFPVVYDESDEEFQETCPEPLGPNISELQALGFSWSNDCGWLLGSYSATVLSSMAENMVCVVEGETTAICSADYIKLEDRCQAYEENYLFYGDVSYQSGNGFICDVAGSTQELLNQAPSSFIKPNGENSSVGGIGILGTVRFERDFGQYDECSGNQTSCDVKNYLTCSDNMWVNNGEVIGKCGVIQQNNQTQNTTSNTTTTQQNQTVMNLCINSGGNYTGGMCNCPSNSVGFKSGFGCDYVVTTQDSDGAKKYIVIGLIIAVILGYIYWRKK